jgi:hypothetical protein
MIRVLEVIAYLGFLGSVCFAPSLLMWISSWIEVWRLSNGQLENPDR